MQDTTDVQLKWQSAADTWSGTKARAFLSKMPPNPLPTSGPLHKLLTATKRALPSPEAITPQAADQAVDAGAVLVLGKLVNWMLQRPCPELLTIHHNQASLSLHLLLKVLCAVDAAKPKGSQDGDAMRSKLIDQLEKSGDCLDGVLPELHK